MATTLSIDIETRSSVDITKCGTTKYVESPDFTILLISFSYGDLLKNNPVITIDLTKEPVPEYFINDLVNPAVIKTAFNAFFERTGLGKYFGVYMPPEQWRCTQIKASTLGLPVKLEFCAKALKLETLKESEGKALIKFFSVPHALTKKDIQDRFSVDELVHLLPDVWEYFKEGITSDSQIYLNNQILLGEDTSRDAVYKKLSDAFKKDCINYIKNVDVMVFYEPHHDPERWERYKHYNNTDVVVELGILACIKWHNIIADEQHLWNIDQEINELGVSIDMVLVNNAIAIDAIYRAELIAEAVQLTGLSNPNSAPQMIRWLNANFEIFPGSFVKDMPDSMENTGEITPTKMVSLRKEDVTALRILLKRTNASINNENIDRVLGIRQELSKTSIKKYFAMQNFVCADGRAHGLLQFYGANRTGRWAGRGIQFQNLRRISLKVDKKRGIDDLGLARKVVRDALKGTDGVIEYEINSGQVKINGIPQYFDDGITDAEIEEC